jgi:ketosteroid isomerase-like protein
MSLNGGIVESTSTRSVIERLFAACEAKDLDAAIRCFAVDAVCHDPHYPTPRMVGRDAITEGLRWAFGSLQKMGFTPIHYLESEDGRVAAVETATAHRLPGGRPLEFQQTFIVETSDGLITRLRSYPPYGPGGIGGLILGLTRLRRRLARRRTPA